MSLERFKNVIKTNPITMAFGDFNATWERATSDRSAMTYSVNIFAGAFGGEFDGFAATVGYKYYFTHSKLGIPEGFYGRILGGILGGEGEVGFRVGGQVGYQWIWDSGFALDLGLGPQVIAIDEDFSGVVPSFFLGIGYAF